jgi:hypothetical protein
MSSSLTIANTFGACHSTTRPHRVDASVVAFAIARPKTRPVRALVSQSDPGGPQGQRSWVGVLVLDIVNDIAGTITMDLVTRLFGEFVNPALGDAAYGVS